MNLYLNQSDDTKQEMARMAAAAAWSLNQWESMEKYVELISNNTKNGAFYGVVLVIHKE